MTRPLAVLVLILGRGLPGLADSGQPLPDLPEMTVETYARVHHDESVLTVELRSDAAIGAAMFERTLRPAAIDRVPERCEAVLVMDETTARDEAARAAERLAGTGCRLFRLQGRAEDWIAAGIAAPAEPRRRIRPGDVPFVVPRGLCESNPPAQVFD